MKVIQKNIEKWGLRTSECLHFIFGFFPRSCVYFGLWVFEWNWERFKLKLLFGKGTHILSYSIVKNDPKHGGQRITQTTLKWLPKCHKIYQDPQ